MTIAHVVVSWMFGPNSHNIHQLCRTQSQLLWNMEFVLLEGNMELIASAEGLLCFSWWQGLVVHSPLLPVPCDFSSVEQLPQKPNSSIRELGESPRDACCDPDKTHAAERKNPAFAG